MIDPGTPVVFLHAFPLDSSLWSAEVARLGGRPVLAPNFPGFGGAPVGAESLDGFAEGVVAAMDAAGIDRAIVVGLSMGGYVAFRLFEGWSDRIAGLVLADTRAGADDEASAARRLEQAERARREGIDWLPDVMLPNLLSTATHQDRPALVDSVRATILRSEPEGVARALLAMRSRPDSTPLLSRIDVPVLAVVGAEDKITPVADARLIADTVPNGMLAVIPGAGHLSNLENPAAFWGAVSPFLN